MNPFSFELEPDVPIGAFVDRLRARSEPKPIDRWLNDPIAWIDDVIRYRPNEGLTSYQRDVCSELARKHRLAVRGPHGLGKTAISSKLVLWFATTRDLAGRDWKVITTASAWRQLEIYLWPEIRKWARRLDFTVLGRPEFNSRTELLDLSLRLNNGAASAVASNDPAKIEGAHADSLLFLFDEAKAIPPATWDAAEGAFSGGEGTEVYALAVSTPGGPTGRFYEIHDRRPGLEDWSVRHVTKNEAVAAGRVSEKWAEQRRLQFGEESAAYKNRVLGEFHTSDDDSVIPLEWIEAANDRWQRWHDAGEPISVAHRRILGVDVAAGGEDSTIFAHRWRLRVGSGQGDDDGVFPDVIARLEDPGSGSTMVTTARVQALLDARTTAIVDSAGAGIGVYDRLRELEEGVIPYVGAAGTRFRDATQSYEFTNVRTAAYWYLREALDPSRNAVLSLPPDDGLTGDLTAPRYTELTGRPPKIQLERKKDVVKRLGRSPDRGDAVVMAMWADRSRTASAVSSGASTLANAPSLTGGRSSSTIFNSSGPARMGSVFGNEGMGRKVVPPWIR